MVVGVVLAILVLVAGLAVYCGRVGAVALAFVSVVWFRVNKPIEGETLLVVTPTHGIAVADMAGIAGLVLACLIWIRPHGR